MHPYSPPGGLTPSQEVETMQRYKPALMSSNWDKSGPPLLFALITGAMVALYLRRRLCKLTVNPRRLPHPPGPKGYPFIGAMFDLPLQSTWLTYDSWLRKYGDMVYFEVLGQSFLVLGSLQRTTDLFDKRSTKYSDRPRSLMVVELMKFDYAMAMIPYGQWWRRFRRAFHQHFNSSQVNKYEHTQVREARMLLRRLLNSPDEFDHHVHHFIAALIMKISYGMSVRETDDPYIFRAQEAIKGFSDAGVAGRYLVERFPVMRFIPSWFPGAGWKRMAKSYAILNELVAVKPFEFVQQRIADGTAPHSVAAALISGLPVEGSPNRKSEEKIARDVVAVSYLAGEDTLASSILSFLLVLCVYPEVQRKAQAELDQVLNGCLPEFSDRPHLPYVNALIHELNRWHLVLPSAIPHLTSDDDEYDGYFIPKGTIVIGNSWSILRDPNTYKEPNQFIPERFLKNGQLDPSVQDPYVAAFGFGRRVCPGRHIGDSSVFIVVASILSVFDVSPPLDENGRPVKLRPLFGGELSSHPLPFKALIIPRSSKAGNLIQHSELPGH